MMASSNASRGWRHYWKEDRIASCLPENEATAREIQERWIDMFADLPDGSRILDVATGNGILLAHAAIAAGRAGKRFLLTGVDLAEIDPIRYVSSLPAGLGDAKFIGRIAAEKLPFSDTDFDVVVSQYGIEYADLDKALDEIERVLAAHGQLIWLAHCIDSAVVEQNRDHAAQVEFLLAPDGPVQAMREFVAKLKKRKKSDFIAKRLGRALTEAEQYCREHPPADVVREVCTVIAETVQRWHAYRPSDLEHMLTDSRIRLIAHRQRINDLSAAVLSPQRLDIIRNRLRPPQWDDVSIGTLTVGSAESPIGLLLRARRTAT